jgi:magnesium chelatase family protein
MRAEKQGVAGLKLNGKISNKYLEEITEINTTTKDFFQRAIECANLSTRGYHKLLRVARTIADMEISLTIQRHHIAEAIQYRLLELT